MTPDEIQSELRDIAHTAASVLDEFTDAERDYSDAIEHDDPEDIEQRREAAERMRAAANRLSGPNSLLDVQEAINRRADEIYE